ncbi:MAG: MFS transporter [Candidatus Shapirobacteria bacterium]
MDFSRNIKILTWQGFFIGFSLWTPIAAIYFSQVSGSYAWGLSIFSVANISGALFEIPTGIFSDKIGRKYTTMMGGLAYTLSGIAYAIGLNFWWLVLGAILGGLGRSFYSGNNDAYLYDSLNKSDKKEELAKFMGIIGFAEQWSLALSALIGGVMAAISFKLVMWISVIPLLMCFVTSWWLIDIKGKKSEDGNIYAHLSEAVKSFVTNKKLRLLSLSSIIGFGIGEAGFQFRSLFILSLWPLWAIGIARMLSNIGAAIGFGVSGKIVTKYKAEKVLMFEQLSTKVVDFISLVWPTVLSPALMASTSIMYGPSTVAENTIFQKEFTDKQRATMGSLNSLGRSVSLAVFIFGLGWIADKTDPRFALICGWMLGLVSVWLTWQLVKLIKAEKRA